MYICKISHITFLEKHKTQKISESASWMWSVMVTQLHYHSSASAKCISRKWYSCTIVEEEEEEEEEEAAAAVIVYCTVAAVIVYCIVTAAVIVVDVIKVNATGVKTNGLVIINMHIHIFQHFLVCSFILPCPSLHLGAEDVA